MRKPASKEVIRERDSIELVELSNNSKIQKIYIPHFRTTGTSQAQPPVNHNLNQIKFGVKFMRAS